MLISIIIPAHNEEKTIATVLERLLSLNFEKEIIVVDDGSTDNTSNIVNEFKNKNKEIKILLIKNNKNLGKGYSIQKAMPYLYGKYVLIQDADLEYNPRDILKLLKETPYHLAVFGQRNFRKGYIHYRIGSYFLNICLNLLFNQNIKDCYTCYKLIETNLFKSLRLSKSGFEIEVEITIMLIKNKIAIKEVAIDYEPRSFKDGKKIRMIDGVKGLKVMLEELF